jgi:hypothetical protein
MVIKKMNGKFGKNKSGHIPNNKAVKMIVSILAIALLIGVLTQSVFADITRNNSLEPKLPPELPSNVFPVKDAEPTTPPGPIPPIVEPTNIPDPSTGAVFKKGAEPTTPPEPIPPIVEPTNIPDPSTGAVFKKGAEPTTPPEPIPPIYIEIIH